MCIGADLTHALYAEELGCSRDRTSCWSSVHVRITIESAKVVTTVRYSL